MFLQASPPPLIYSPKPQAPKLPKAGGKEDGVCKKFRGLGSALGDVSEFRGIAIILLLN